MLVDDLLTLVLAVRRHPEINASWDDERQEIVYKHYVNLGIAAATPRGLVVPNIKDAHRLGLHALAVEIAHLTATARAGRTSPADLSDGTITITNVGVFGIDTGTPILNPGEAGILAFGAIRKQPWVHKGKVRSRWVTQLALSFDHRLADGELGSRVLADVVAILGDRAPQRRSGSADQQIRGSCSPIWVSMTRVEPIAVFATTMPGWPATTSPMIAARVPISNPRITASARSR